MTGSTSQESRAVKAMEEGNLDFKVLATVKHDDSTQYIIALPKATVRKGLISWVYAKFGKGNGYTKFGRDMYLTLNCVNHVEASVGNDAPHVLTVFTDVLMSEQRLASHVVKGLPEEMAVMIQTVIFRNNNLLQRAAEGLRRLF
jgi:hypothetical protein